MNEQEGIKITRDFSKKLKQSLYRCRGCGCYLRHDNLPCKKCGTPSMNIYSVNISNISHGVFKV